MHVLFPAILLIARYGKTRNLQSKESRNQNPSYGNRIVLFPLKRPEIREMSTFIFMYYVAPNFWGWQFLRFSLIGQELQKLSSAKFSVH